MSSKTRGAPRAPKTDPATVRAAAEADRARKAASKAALRAAKAPTTEPASTQTPDPTPVARPERDHGAENLAAARAEAEATGMSFEEACDSMGVDPATGQPVEADKPRYNGPMLALVAARKAYVKAANGILCNGSPLALLCGRFKRDVVVAGLIRALKLPGNPYAHLNPGQQSMNLRNKARAAITNGTLTLAEIEACLIGAAE